MTYRDRPESKSKTESLPIRWRDYARYWVRVTLRWLVRWSLLLLGVALWGAVGFTVSMSPTETSLRGALIFCSSIMAGGWTVAIGIECGPDVLVWIQAKDRLER